MSKRTTGILLALFTALQAKQPPAECGPDVGRRQEEGFLHARNAALRARRGLSHAIDREATAGNVDIGQIAVIDDSGGVIGRRNLFDLDRTTLSFTPVASGGYTLTIGGDTFDATAAAGGTILAGLGDDDTRSVNLPFAFPFYSASYSKLFVNSNGNVTFGSGDTDSSGSFGHFAAGPPRISPLFTDLDPSQSSDGVHVLAEAARVVITFASVPLYNSGAFGFPPIENFQIRLFPDGRIEIAYRGAAPPAAVVGITPGRLQPVGLVNLSSSPGAFTGGIAESFSQQDAVDVFAAAQKFYQTHDDAYDYLVFYNSEGVAAGPGVVAFEITARSTGLGFGDTNLDDGADYGSKSRLKSVLNLGPLSQYPTNPNAVVPARFITGDTPLTILGHESGHLFLALTSVRNPADITDQPMLGRALVHWAFTYNSEASLLEGNRVQDLGAGASPRFRTIATSEGYAPLDQYLMGFRPPEEVPPTFAVLNATVDRARAPQTGVPFDGQRLDVAIGDIINIAGRRTPDSTVAQRQFRFAFVLIVPPGAAPDPNAVAQVDRYRSEFEGAYLRFTSSRATADTSLRSSVALSLAPNAGVVAGTNGTATIEIARPAATPIAFTLVKPNQVIATPAIVTIPAGGTRVSFPVFGTKVGVEEFSAQPSDTSYETAIARVQVTATETDLRLAPVSIDTNAQVRVVDRNNTPYSGVRVTSGAAAAITDERGSASFPAPGGAIDIAIDNLAASSIRVGAPVINAGGVVNGASFTPAIAAGGFVTIFGKSLAAAAFANSPAPFPTSLRNVSVTIGGTPAPIVSISDSQVNVLAPFSLQPGSADVVVETPLGTSGVAKATVAAYAPGVFFDSATGLGAILIAGTANTTATQPAKPGDYIEIYCTGLGAVDRPVTVKVAGLDALVVYAGATQISGLYQVDAQIPANSPAGVQNLVLSISGQPSNPVKIALATSH
jgi:uncharacterized protein (TIGR03437 family)